MRNSIRRFLERPGDLLGRLLRLLESGWFAWALLALGAILRLREYLLNNALYVDEAALSLNVINKSVSGLFGRLDSNQAAPVGFLMIEKLAVGLFGPNEYALRLFPLLFSLATLPLLYKVARHYLPGPAMLMALGLFVASGQVIHYTAQVKQYTLDIALALAITLAGVYLAERELTLGRVLWLTLLGAAAVWFSYSSVFMLAGVGGTLSLAALWRRYWRRLGGLAVVCSVWVISFATFFLLSLRVVSGNVTLEQSWENKGTFMPLPPRSASDLKWFPETLLRMFENPMHSRLPIVAALALIVGCIALYRTSRQRLLLLALPVLLTLMASGVHKYPFGKRLILFLVPTVVLMMAAAVHFFLSRSVLWQALGVTVALLLVAGPLAGALGHARWPASDMDVRKIMAYVRDHRQPADLTYFYHTQMESYQYYAPKLGFREGEYILGADARDKIAERADWDAYRANLDHLRGRGRVWLVFSHVRVFKGVNEEEFMRAYVDTFGRRLESYEHAGMAACLYDTSQR